MLDRSMTARRSLLIVTDAECASTAVVRGLRYLDAFRSAGWSVDTVDCRVAGVAGVALRARGADVVYLLKTRPLALVPAIRLASRARVVFDLTDALWRPPFAQDWPHLEALLASVDAVFALNELDSAFARRFNPTVVAIPVGIPFREYEAARARVPPRDPARVVVGWIGSVSTVPALFRIADALDAVAARHRSMKLRVVGCPSDEALPRFRHVEVSRRGAYDEPGMFDELVSLDVGLYPWPLDADDYRVRGPQKALLYMGAGVAPVCEAVGDCARIVTDGVDGMLAEDEAAWERKLDALVASRELRERVGRAAHARVERAFAIEPVFEKLAASLDRVAEQPAAGREVAWAQLGRTAQRLVAEAGRKVARRASLRSTGTDSPAG